MAGLSRDEVAHVAKLARLELTDDELDTYTTQLAAILDHAADVEALDAYHVWDGWVIVALVLWAIASETGRRADPEYAKLFTKAKELGSAREATIVKYGPPFSWSRVFRAFGSAKCAKLQAN